MNALRTRSRAPPAACPFQPARRACGSFLPEIQEFLFVLILAERNRKYNEITAVKKFMRPQNEPIELRVASFEAASPKTKT
jgi:hypothetical protein